MNKLSFAALRRANAARVGHFKNKAGEPAHTKPDGSDWNFGQWMEALMGEVGEVAEVRLAYEEGRIDKAVYAIRIAKELADVQTYLDLLAMRALDESTPGYEDHSTRSMEVMATFGMYCEARKKFNRRDITLDELNSKGTVLLMHAVSMTASLLERADTINTPSVKTDSDGIDLGRWTTEKFNEVSIRVGSPVRIHPESGAPMIEQSDGTWLPAP